MTAALIPGAAVSVHPAHACTLIQPSSPAEFVAEAQVIVIGTVESRDGRTLTLRPEAFLKGPASSERMQFRGVQDTCDPAPLRAGDRTLIYVFDAAAPRYPYVNEAYLLKDGSAIMGKDQSTETEVVSAIRGVTGQYVVPVSSRGEGAGIDWSHTVVPLGLALGLVFIIGLVLMRVWHRIDPS